MIDEKKLIEELKERERTHMCDFNVFDDAPEAQLDIAHCLQELQEVMDIVRKQPKVVTDTNVGCKWIPCSEKPNCEGTYIVAWLPAFKDEKGKKIALPCPYPHFYTLGDYYDDEWDIKVSSAYYEYILLAWMQLPAPYNAERGGKNE